MMTLLHATLLLTPLSLADVSVRSESQPAPPSGPRAEALTFIRTLESAEALSFHLKIDESLYKIDPSSEQSRKAAAALAHLEADVAMTRHSAEIRVRGSDLVIRGEQGKVLISQPDGKTVSFDVNGREWADHLDSLQVNWCPLSSYLETWLGPDSWFREWLEKTVAKTVVNGDSLEIRNDGEYPVEILVPVDGLLTAWSTVNEMDFVELNVSLLVERVRSYSDFKVRPPEAKAVSKKQAPP